MEIKKRSRIFVVWLILAVSLIVLLVSLYFRPSIILDKKDIPIFLKIGNVTGIRVENESLDFGTITYESSAQKTINLENNYKFPVNIFFSCNGDVCDFLTYDSQVSLSPLEKKQAYFSTIVFSNQTYGNYSGKMQVVFKRAVE